MIKIKVIVCLLICYLQINLKVGYHLMESRSETERLMDYIRVLESRIEENRVQSRLELWTDFRDEMMMMLREEMWQDFRSELRQELLREQHGRAFLIPIIFYY
jgi:hypothetical protein